jgi:O-antigen/teichoic acid export membrane protein
MSLRTNVAASFASQIYVTLIGIVMIPIYLAYMGVESIGLIGFFAMLQAWFQLLDFGLAPTLSRETARFAGGATDGLSLRRLLRMLEAVFASVALLGALGLGISAHWIASQWLQVQQLPPEQVERSVQLMAAIIGLRWMAGLYRGALGGFEQQVWLGRLNVMIATASCVAVVPVFEFVGTLPVLFFSYQLIVAIVETTILIARTYAQLPALPAGTLVGFDPAPLRGVLPFALNIAFIGAIWVAVTQTDKLLLSKLLPLTEYAHFTLAVLVASGVSIISGPLSTALLPRLSRLHAQGQDVEIVTLYRQATRAMTVIATPVALVLTCAAEPLLRAWTGDAALAADAAPILQLYALGNGILALSSFPYYLQFAKGNIRLHLVGSALFVAILLPSVWLATRQHGAIGAGWAWLGANATYALLWVPLVHGRFAPGLHLQWLMQDIAPIAVPVVLGTLLVTHWIPWPSNRLGVASVLLLFGLLMLALAALACSQVRSFLRDRLVANRA